MQWRSANWGDPKVYEQMFREAPPSHCDDYAAIAKAAVTLKFVSVLSPPPTHLSDYEYALLQKAQAKMGKNRPIAHYVLGEALNVILTANPHLAQ